MDEMPPTSELAPVTAAPIETHKPERIAGIGHTVFLAVLLVGFSLLGAKSQHKFTAAHGKVLLYQMTIGWEWLMVLYVWFGIRRRTKLRELISQRWSSALDALLDVAIGVGLYFALIMLLAALAVALGMVKPDAAHGAAAMKEAKEKLGFIMPRTNVELLWFMAVSATAGICEEIIFRGYFLKQFAAFTGTVIGGVVIQALLFGAAHGYEGGKRMVLIAAEGVLFGAIAVWRKSLRPGMVAHFMQDAISGAVGRWLLR